MQLAIAAATISQPLPVGAGSIITVTPDAGATAVVEYTSGDAAAVANGVAAWAPWSRGTAAGATSDLVTHAGFIRVTARAGGAAIDINENPSANSLADFRTDFSYDRARAGATTVIFGDSITNQNTQQSATFAAHLAKGYFTQANIMLEQRFELLNNAGVSGDTTALMLSRLNSDVLAYKPKNVIFMGGTNDVGNDIPYATTIANFTAIFGKIIGAGIRLIIQTIMPRALTGISQAKLLNLIALNNWLQAYAARNPGVVLIDMYRQLLDYTDITSVSQGNPVAAWFDGPGLHPLAAGAVQMGLTGYRQLDPIIPRVPRRLHCNYNGTNGDSTNYIRNGMLMQGSGGTPGANTTGVVPQNWTGAAASGTIAAVGSIVARAASFNDGTPGNVWRLAISGSGATTEIYRATPGVVSTPPIGTPVFMEVEVMASASTGTINEISIIFGTVGGTVIAAAGNYMGSNTETLAIGTTVYKGVIRTPAININAGAVGAYCQINIRTSAGAVAQVDLANVRFTAAG